MRRVFDDAECSFYACAVVDLFQSGELDVDDFLSCPHDALQ